MTAALTPTIWMYGGVHHDPRSRQRFIEELAQRETAPHFVAVEWEQSLFERLVAWRSWVAEGLRDRWDFLMYEDCHEISLALAWEGDAYTECFPDANVLWLENGYQEADLKRRYPTDASRFPESCANGLLQRLDCPRTMQEFFANIDPPKPRSKKELVERVGRVAWAELVRDAGGFERDARRERRICERSTDLRDGWVAVVVGWAHANPQEDPQRLRGRLSSRSFCVNSVCLGP